MSSSKTRHELKIERTFQYLLGALFRREISAISHHQIAELMGILNPPRTRIDTAKSFNAFHESNRTSAREVAKRLVRGSWKEFWVGELTACHRDLAYTPLRTLYHSECDESSLDIFNSDEKIIDYGEPWSGWESALAARAHSTALETFLTFLTFDGKAKRETHESWLGVTSLYIDGLRCCDRETLEHVSSPTFEFRLAGDCKFVPQSIPELRQIEREFFLTFCHRMRSGSVSQDNLLQGATKKNAELLVAYIDVDAAAYCPQPIDWNDPHVSDFRERVLEDGIRYGAKLNEHWVERSRAPPK